MGILVIIGFLLYVAIGGIIAGVANEYDFEALMITIAWPIFCIMWLCYVFWKLPYKFGNWLICKYLRRKR